MRRIFNVLVLIPLLFATSCSGPGKIMNEWVGKTKDELYKVMGPASRVIDNGKDGQILMYSAEAMVYSPPPPEYDVTINSDPRNHVEAGARQTKPYLKVKLFYVNPGGIIYSWKVKDV